MKPKVKNQKTQKPKNTETKPKSKPKPEKTQEQVWVDWFELGFSDDELDFMENG